MIGCKFIANHVKFMGQNRGTVSINEDWSLLESPKQECSCAYQLQDQVGGLPNSDQLYVYDSAVLKSAIMAGYKAVDKITHMSLKKDLKMESKENFRIHEVKEVDDIHIFSEVQCRGFLEAHTVYESWSPFLKEMNLKSFKNEDQKFYLGYLGDRVVTVAMALSTEATLGIYAVATLPDFRRQGLSSILMSYLAHEGVRKNLIPCLQVKTNSPAHQFYMKLGFEDEFEVHILKR